MRLTKVLFRHSQLLDVLVIGGGHAGCEAAHIAAKAGAKTCLVTQKESTIGQMSCNPSMGGIGKGHLIRQVEALGGLIGKVSDMSATHYRMLNQSKGYSAQGLRAIIDRDLYKAYMLAMLKKTQKLSILQGSVEDFLMSKDGESVEAVLLKNGEQLRANQVILTTGTFLRGIIYIGDVSYPAGRHRRDSSEVQPPSIALSSTIQRLGFELGRYKTGTPPRLSLKSIDFTKLTPQKSQKGFWFSYTNEFKRQPYPNPLLASYITKTNPKTHQIVQQNIQLLPDFQTGTDRKYGQGPRYCPSIQTKIKRFPNIQGHTVFLQFQGANSDVIYPLGLTTSLPLQAQKQMVRSVKGLQQAQIIRPAYAIQYDFVDPKQLELTLRTKKVNNLYLAGQINGTTGYEEAASQGIVAGINAALASQRKQKFILERTNSMVGVLISDIIGLGVSEPYRMITTRSEHRLLQRFDNADERLTPQAHKLGLISEEQFQIFQEKSKLIAQGLRALEFYSTSNCQWAKKLPQVTKNTPAHRSAAEMVASHHKLSVRDFSKWVSFDERVEHNLNVILKYRNVLQMEKNRAQKIKKELLNIKIDMGLLLKYQKQFPSEEYEKLIKERPQNLYLATRIRGIRETTIQTLAFINRPSSN